MLHKLSADHVRNYDLIAFEDLVPSNMVKDHKLVKAIQDASWSEFRRQLVYKGTGKWWSRLILPLRSALLVLRGRTLWQIDVSMILLLGLALIQLGGIVISDMSQNFAVAPHVGARVEMPR